MKRVFGKRLPMSVLLVAFAGSTLLLTGCPPAVKYGWITTAVMNPIQITFTEDRHELDLAISWDGKKLAFAECDLDFEDFNIWACDAVTGGRLQLVRDSEYDERYPSWYPDGEWILYEMAGFGDLGGRIWKVRANRLGGNTMIGSQRERCVDPRLSPDGTEITYVTGWDFEYEGGIILIDNPRVWVMKENGSQPQEITHGQWPAWSPDGRKLAFSKRTDDQFDIWVIGRDGSAPTQITHGDADEIHPCWSPSGEEIAFASNASEIGDWNIYKCRSTGGGLTQITEAQSDEMWPAWAPGGYLFFSSDHMGDSFDIWRVQVLRSY